MLMGGPYSHDYLYNLILFIRSGHWITFNMDHLSYNRQNFELKEH